MRTKLIIAVFAFLLPLYTISQIRIDTIKSDERPDELLFPLVRHPNPAVAKKINNYLQSNILENTTKKLSPGKLFDRRKFIMNDSVNRSGITYCAFSDMLNTKKLLSLQIDFEYMGAYPSSSSQYFNFNAQNGEPIFVEDLFTSNGLNALRKKIHAERIKRIKDYTKEIADDNSNEFRDDLDYINEKLTECLEYDTLDGFILLKEAMIFHRANCFPHVVQNYMTDLDVTFSFKEVSSWLNDFGKRALLINSAPIEQDTKPGLMKPFYGSIGGKYPIVLQFNYMSSGLNGFYYYESQGICIEISGRFSENSIILEEMDDEGNITATFNGTYNGKQITGTWTPSKTGKALPFSVKN